MGRQPTADAESCDFYPSSKLFYQLMNVNVGALASNELSRTHANVCREEMRRG